MGATLRGATLDRARLTETDLRGVSRLARLTGHVLWCSRCRQARAAAPNAANNAK